MIGAEELAAWREAVDKFGYSLCISEARRICRRLLAEAEEAAKLRKRLNAIIDDKFPADADHERLGDVVAMLLDRLWRWEH